MRLNKKVIYITIVMILVIAFPLTVLAHSGRTDSRGGHKDNKNKSGLGSYHYHCGGNPPHLHPDGVCPYSSSSSTKSATTYTKPKPTIKVSGVSTKMNVGDSCVFSATISNSTNNSISVTSSNSKVVQVNRNNKLIAKGVGVSIITIGNKTVSKNFTITVKEVFAQKILFSTNLKEIQIGDELKIEATISPSNTTNKSITYKSSDENIATVSDNGTIKGISSGEVTITATTSNGISKAVTLTIFEVFPEKIKCDDSIKLIVGDECEFIVDILPDNANNKEYTTTVENEEILNYANNKIYAKKEGETLIHIETWNGIIKKVPVRVDIIPVESVTIVDSTEYIHSNIMDISSEILLSTQVAPDDSTYKDVSWSSSNPSVVNVENDKFVVKGMGKTTLTCSTHNNITDSIQIIVIDKDLILSTSLCGVGVVGSTILIRKRKRKDAASI